MAGGSFDDSLIGVGSALRKAREHRRVTLDEASRDTKLRADQLRALEDEEFDLLLGEPYVRGALRTYSTYLGLNADKVAEAYARHAEETTAPPPPEKLGRIERAIMATRIRDDQRLVFLAALALIVVGVALGLLSRGNSTPAPANLPTVAAVAKPPGQTIEAVLTADRTVAVTIVADGLEQTSTLARGESVSFAAETTLVLRVADGGAVHVTLNGSDLGVPGQDGKPWHKTFTFNTGVSPSPSA